MCTSPPTGILDGGVVGVQVDDVVDGALGDEFEVAVDGLGDLLGQSLGMCRTLHGDTAVRQRVPPRW